MVKIECRKGWVLSDYQENRLRVRLRRTTCSEPWVDDQIRVIEDTGPDGERIVYRFHNPFVFPPGGSKTGMKQCDGCGRWTPGPAISLIERRFSRRGLIVQRLWVCDDCRIAEDEMRYAEIYAAYPNLRPAGSKTVVR